MFAQESVMGIKKQKNLYLAKLLEQEVIKQDEFEDLVFKPEINAFHSNYLSSRFMDNINFGWSAWQAATAQAVPKWISVEDGLPSDGQNIIAFDAIKHCVFKDGEFLQGYFESDTGHEYTEPVDVTHWIAIEPQEPTND